MDFALGQDLESIRDEATRLAAKFDDDYWLDHDERKAFPWAFYNAFAEQGWIGVVIPEQYGGAGLGVMHAGVLLQAVAGSAGAMNAASTLHLSIFGMGPVIHHGSRGDEGPLPAAHGEGRAARLVRRDRGRRGHRHLAHPHLRDVRDGDRFIVNGKKVWNTKAQQAQKILLLARTTPREECAAARGDDAVPGRSRPAHCEIREIPKLGRNAVNSNEVFIHDLPVKARRRGGRGRARLLPAARRHQPRADHDRGRGLSASGAAPSTWRCATRASASSSTGPIGQNQAIAHPLADSYSELEAAELLWQKAAWAYDRGEPDGRGSPTPPSCAAGEASLPRLRPGPADLRRLRLRPRVPRRALLAGVPADALAPISQEMARNYLAEHVLGLATFALVVLGALVRARNAGLACPDWPLCHGALVPAFDIQVLFEWSHRGLAGSVSLGLLALTLVIWRRPALRAGVGRALVVAWSLLAVQVVLGGLTVLLRLAPWTVTAHLLVGTSFCVTLLWITRDLFEGETTGGELPGAVRVWLAASAVALVAQIALGGIVSSHGAGLACGHFPTCDGTSLVPPLQGLVGLHTVHRLVAYALAGLYVALVVAARRTALAPFAYGALALVLLQVAVGVANVLLRVPVEVTGLHSGVACALALVTALMVRRSLRSAPQSLPLPRSSGRIVEAA